MFLEPLKHVTAASQVTWGFDAFSLSPQKL